MWRGVADTRRKPWKSTVAGLGSLLPSGGMDLIQNQIQSLAAQGSNALSFGFITGLLIALWSANSGIKTLFDAMNIAYEEEEKRSFIKANTGFPYLHTRRHPDRHPLPD